MRQTEQSEKRTERKWKGEERDDGRVEESGGERGTEGTVNWLEPRSQGRVAGGGGTEGTARKATAIGQFHKMEVVMGCVDGLCAVKSQIKAKRKMRTTY